MNTDTTSLRLVLAGPHTGKTIVINGHQFVKGVAVLRGSAANLTGAELYLRNYYQAYREGSQELRNAQSAWAEFCAARKATHGKRDLSGSKLGDGDSSVSSTLQPDGSGASTKATDDSGSNGDSKTGSTESMAGGSGSASANATGGSPDLTKVREALQQLDPENAEHWTNAGTPTVAAVSKVLGIETTRAMIEAALPGFNREAAKKK